MLQFLLFAIPIFLVYKVLKSLWVRNQMTLAKHSLYRLRDQLRWEVINNRVDEDDEAAKYLDQSIGKAALVISHLNFWLISYGIYKQRAFVTAREFDEMDKRIENNPMLNRINNSYRDIIFSHLVLKSYVTVVLFRPIWNYFLKSVIKSKKPNDKGCGDEGKQKNEKARESYEKYMTRLPETSANNLIFA